MKNIYKYNHLFFSEKSYYDDINNMTFWTRLSDFDMNNPDADLTVIRNVKRDRYSGKYVECLEFQCSRDEDYKQVQKIYADYYCPTPLEFVPFLDHEPTDEDIHCVGKKNG